MIGTFLKFLFKRSSENAACVSIDAAQYMSPKHLKEIADYLRGLADDKKYREGLAMTDQQRFKDKREGAGTFAGLSDRVEQEIERAYWAKDAKKSGQTPMSDRDAFKWAVREMFHRLREPK